MSTRDLSIAIPASVISDTPHLREKTAKVGLVGRAAAIFRVDEIIVYLDGLDRNQQRDARLLDTLLSYMETPQYLRKRLFPMNSDLQYAGILPPLRTPHHPLERRATNLKNGEYREGATVSASKEGTYVDIGVEKPILLSDERLDSGKRITVQISKQNGRVKIRHADPKDIKEYWGFKVSSDRQMLSEVMRSRKFDLTIATSKLGTSILKVLDDITIKMKGAASVIVAFGSPSRGLYDIAKGEGFDLEKMFDFTVNMVPNQSTETVRTEEAVLASLAVFNVLFANQA